MKIISIAFALMMLSFTQAFAEVSPMSVTGATTIDVQKAAELFDDGTVFVDVRKGADFDAGRIPGAVHLDLNSDFTAENLEKAVGKSEAVVLYCNGESCMRSSEASQKAVEWGWTIVFYFRDGFPAWDAEGLPVE